MSRKNNIGAMSMASPHIGDSYALRTAQSIGANVSVVGKVVTFTALLLDTATFGLSVVNPNGTGTSHGLLISAGQNGASGSDMILFQRPDGTVIGSVSQASTTAVAYNTTSDGRLKEDVNDFDRGLQLVNRIRVRNFRFKTDPHRTVRIGFVAQELAEVYPEAVSAGGEDPVKSPWGVDHGRLTPILVRAVQELTVKLSSMADRLALLENVEPKQI